MAMGLLLGYFLFVPLFLGLFGTKGKNWWTAVLTLPIFVWAIYMDVRLTQLAPLVFISIGGFFIGVIGNRVLWKLVPGVMAKVG